MPPIQNDVPLLQIFPAGDQHVVHVPLGRGEELRIHLRSHGVDSLVSQPAETPYERLELPGDIDPEAIQAILDQWEG